MYTLKNWLYSHGNYKFIAIDLSKQQKLDFDLKKILQINFTGNIERKRGI